MFRRPLITIALIFAAAGSACTQPVDRNGGSDAASRERQAEPADDDEPVNLLPVQDLLNRIASALEAANAQPETAEEQARAQGDLTAQKDMAFWAKWMLVATAVGVFFTAIGIVLLRQTLKASREAVAEARRIGEAQTRAYVDARAASLVIDGRDNRVIISIANSGQSPVKYFRVGSVAYVRTQGSAASYQIPDEPGNPKYGIWTGLGAEITKTVRQQPDRLAESIKEANDAVGGHPALAVVVAGRILYGNIFDEEWETEFAFFLYPPFKSGRNKMLSPVARMKAYEKREKKTSRPNG